jgi:hypothetical protein
MIDTVLISETSVCFSETTRRQKAVIFSHCVVFFLQNTTNAPLPIQITDEALGVIFWFTYPMSFTSLLALAWVNLKAVTLVSQKT